MTRLRGCLLSLALALASLALLVGLLELGARFAGYEPIHAIYSKPSLLWKRDALLGWSHEPGGTETYVGPRPYPIEYEVEIRINSLGLRGPEVTPLPPDGYRVLVLGDSLVAGFEVPYEETFEALAQATLEERLGIPVQVINAGVRGYGTDQSLLYYRDRGRSLAPDLVVLVHSRNDPGDNITLHRMRRPFGKAAFAPGPDGSLVLVGHPIPDYPLCSARSLDSAYRPRDRDTLLTRAFCRLQIQLFEHSALFSFLLPRLRQSGRLLGWLYDLGGSRHEEEAAARPGLRRAAGFLSPGLLAASAGGPGSAVRFDRALTSDLILELQREVRSDGADFLLYVGPDDLRELDWRRLEAAGLERLFPPPLGELQDPRAFRFRNDGHFNAAGHRFFARPLAEWIEQHARAVRARAHAASPGEGASNPP